VEKRQKRRHLLTSSRDVLTRNTFTRSTALTSITSLYERPVYRSYGLRVSKDDDDDDDDDHKKAVSRGHRRQRRTYLEVGDECLVGVDVVLRRGQIDSHVRTLLDHCLANLRVPAAQLRTQHTPPAEIFRLRNYFKTSGNATWFTAGGAIRIALRQRSQTWKLRHYDVIDDVITRNL